MWSRVVLPEPEGPTIAASSPAQGLDAAGIAFLHRAQLEYRFGDHSLGSTSFSPGWTPGPSIWT
jgi:hypothetical protein